MHYLCVLSVQHTLTPLPFPSTVASVRPTTGAPSKRSQRAARSAQKAPAARRPLHQQDQAQLQLVLAERRRRRRRRRRGADGDQGGSEEPRRHGMEWNGMEWNGPVSLDDQGEGGFLVAGEARDST